MPLLLHMEVSCLKMKNLLNTSAGTTEYPYTRVEMNLDPYIITYTKNNFRQITEQSSSNPVFLLLGKSLVSRHMYNIIHSSPQI